ncbi:hypothetical protein [Peribacillus simplex]
MADEKMKRTLMPFYLQHNFCTGLCVLNLLIIVTFINVMGMKMARNQLLY